MAFGDVYRHETTAAIGYQSRLKLLMHVAEPSYKHDHLLLFISSADYGGDLPIKRLPHHRFLEYSSFISFGTTVEQGDVFESHKLGLLHPPLYARLYRAASESRSMVEFRSEILAAMHAACVRRQTEALTSIGNVASH